jgi:hypothetical protein
MLHFRTRLTKTVFRAQTSSFARRGRQLRKSSSPRSQSQSCPLVQDLKSSGVPIDGVGLQMHISAGARPSDPEIAANIARSRRSGSSQN